MYFKNIKDFYHNLEHFHYFNPNTANEEEIIQIETIILKNAIIFFSETKLFNTNFCI